MEDNRHARHKRVFWADQVAAGGNEETVSTASRRSLTWLDCRNLHLFSYKTLLIQNIIARIKTRANSWRSTFVTKIIAISIIDCKLSSNFMQKNKLLQIYSHLAMMPARIRCLI